MHGTSSMVGRVGRYADPRSVARAGSLFRSLVGSHGSPPVHDQRAVGDYTKPTTEATIMAINAASTGKIRPASRTPKTPLANADGHIIGEIRWVREATVIKRIRRALAAKGKTLLKTRKGTTAYRELGEYAVFDERHVLELKLVNIRLLAGNLGVLADDEGIDPPSNKGFRHYVARQVTVEVDGRPCLYNEPVTKDYTTPEAALKAAAWIEDREGLVLCGFDASLAKGGTNDADL
jgi:hypothetical protein